MCKIKKEMQKSKKTKKTKKSNKKPDGARGTRGARAVVPPPTTARDARAAARNARGNPAPVVRQRPPRPAAQERPAPARPPLQRPRVQQPPAEEEEEDEPYIYCGNNAIHPDLVNGTARAGSRLECLRRGFGAGFHSAVDLSFLQPYRPIDARRKYCGNQEILPDGYDMFGNAPSCFQKGWATGKRSRAMNPNGRRR